MEQVNHPSHYAKVSPAGRLLLDNFCVFAPTDYDRECDLVMVEYGWDGDAYLYNAAKYLWRAGAKGELVTDLKKAAWYLRRWLEVHESSHLMHSGPVEKTIDAIEDDIQKIESFFQRLGGANG